MQTSRDKRYIIFGVLALICFLSSCTDWEKKYSTLKVEHQNTVGLLDYQQLQENNGRPQPISGRQTIEEIRRRITLYNKTAAEVTGFGKSYNVTLDATTNTITITLSNTILFRPGKIELRRSCFSVLEHIISVLGDKYPDNDIDVVGHTDSDFIKSLKCKDNWELSARRSLSVVRYMVSNGIAKDKIRQAACGSSRPIASNETPAGKAKNRRIEIVIHLNQS